MSVFPQVWTKYKRNSNETPLHVLERIAAPTRIQQVVSRYWARMAYVDIGHIKAQELFKKTRKDINYNNLDSNGGGRYRVKASRQPRYMGANIIPLKATGPISVNVTAATPFMATLAIRSESGNIRYFDLKNGSGKVDFGQGDEASLVVVNTPSTLALFDPFSLTAELNRGLDYQIQLLGASV
jgi:hypothetical protein